MPSILLECGFISNYSEAKKAADEANQNKLSVIIVEQVNRMFNK